MNPPTFKKKKSNKIVRVEIKIVSLLEGAQQAEGTVIIVDVFRAFTTASVALSRGISKIIFVADPDEALALRLEGKADICVGEVGGIPPEGYDFGNSPHELSTANLAGKVMAHSTRAGTVGVNAASKADRVYGGSFANAEATVNAILQENPELVTIVAMGLAGKERTDEDELCAIYLRNLLEGRQSDADAVRKLILCGKEVIKFMDPDQPYLHFEDVVHALDISSINHVVQVEKEDGLLVTRAC